MADVVDFQVVDNLKIDRFRLVSKPGKKAKLS